MNAKDRKLPKVGVVRYGHASTVKGRRFYGRLASDGFFDRSLEILREKYLTKKDGDKNV